MPSFPDTLQTLLDQHGLLPDVAPVALTPRVWRWQAKDNVYLAKKLIGSVQQRQQAILQYQCASDHHLGPHVVATSSNATWLVLHFQPGHPPTLADLKQPQCLQAMAILLANIHHIDATTMDTPWPTSIMHLFEMWCDLPTTVQTLLLPDTTLATLQHACTQCLEATSTRCWTHQDFHPLNILWQPTPMAMDWEYAGWGVPEMDVAMMMQYLPSSQHDAWCQLYRQYSSHNIEKNTVLGWIDLLHIKCAIWAIYQAHQINPQQLASRPSLH